MPTITKYFKTLKAAERFHNKLYDKYDKVTATRTPPFSEHGTYEWEVADPINTFVVSMGRDARECFLEGDYYTHVLNSSFRIHKNDHRIDSVKKA